MKVFLFIAGVSLALAGCGRDAKDMASVARDATSPPAHAPVAADIVPFHIGAHTGHDSWNGPDGVVVLKVGQTLRIYNDDSVNHQLHTFGKPFPHGPVMEPGQFKDHVATQTFLPQTDNEQLFDHFAGPNAKFYLKVVAP